MESKQPVRLPALSLLFRFAFGLGLFRRAMRHFRLGMCFVRMLLTLHMVALAVMFGRHFVRLRCLVVLISGFFMRGFWHLCSPQFAMRGARNALV